MCEFYDNIKRIAFSEETDEEKLARIAEETGKELLLEYLENNPEFGISLEELGLPSDFELNIEDYAHKLDDSDYAFSIPDEGDVQGSLDPINIGLPSPGPGLGQKQRINVYKYASQYYGASNIGDNSRSFCIRVVNMTNVRLLTFSEIQLLNSQNPGFGKGGGNNYSVFRYRGGTNCRHEWFKFIFDIQSGTFIKAPSTQQPIQVPLR